MIQNGKHFLLYQGRKSHATTRVLFYQIDESGKTRQLPAATSLQLSGKGSGKSDIDCTQCYTKRRLPAAALTFAFDWPTCFLRKRNCLFRLLTSMVSMSIWKKGTNRESGQQNPIWRWFPRRDLKLRSNATPVKTVHSLRTLCK